MDCLKFVQTYRSHKDFLIFVVRSANNSNNKIVGISITILEYSLSVLNDFIKWKKEKGSAMISTS
jgi:hypothetical protein